MIHSVPIFSGLAPKDNDRLMDKSNAQIADWARLDNAALRPWRAPAKVAGPCGYMGSGGAETGGGATTGSGIFTGTLTVLQETPSYSCVFGFWEIETSPGNWEIWAAWDYGSMVSAVVHISRFDRDSGILIGTITTTIYADWSTGGVTGQLYDGKLWLFGKNDWGYIQTSSPFTVYRYGGSDPNVRVITVPDSDPSYVWIQYPGSGYGFYKWSLDTRNWAPVPRARTLTFTNMSYLQNYVMDSDGTLFVGQDWANPSREIVAVSPLDVATTYPYADSTYPMTTMVQVGRDIYGLTADRLLRFNMDSRTYTGSWYVDGPRGDSVVSYRADIPALFWNSAAFGESVYGYHLTMFDINTEQVGMYLLDTYRNDYGSFFDSTGTLWLQGMSPDEPHSYQIRRFVFDPPYGP